MVAGRHQDFLRFPSTSRVLGVVIERQAIQRGRFGSVKDLNAKVRAFVDASNDRSHPFAWT